jgi:hypothetical protein
MSFERACGVRTGKPAARKLRSRRRQQGAELSEAT